MRKLYQKEPIYEGLKLWYDGYQAASGERLYNPRSVVQALRYNHLESYWTSSGPYDEIFYYIEKNIAEVLAARDFYRIEREDKAGIGYVDFIFYLERNKKDDCIILELKVGHSTQEAIQQIKKKQYILRFEPKIGEERRYTGRILLVGIAYEKETKKHSCEIQVLDKFLNRR